MPKLQHSKQYKEYLARGGDPEKYHEYRREKGREYQREYVKRMKLTHEQVEHGTVVEQTIVSEKTNEEKKPEYWELLPGFAVEPNYKPAPFQKLNPNSSAPYFHYVKNNIIDFDGK